MKITLSKARSQARRHTARKRDVNAEIRNVEPWMLEAFAAEPGPSEAATLLDQIDTMLRGLPDAYGEILALRLQGSSLTEIAGKLGISRQTVYRAVSLLKDRLAASLAGGP